MFGNTSGLGKLTRFVEAQVARTVAVGIRPLARGFVRHFPWSRTVYLRVQWAYGRFAPLKPVFTRIHEENRWGVEETSSGPGSQLAYTASIRKELPLLLKQLKVRSMLDAACGDFNWLGEMQLDLDRYLGIDIVPELIIRDKALYGNSTRDFVELDLTRGPLPHVDLVLCRDCLVHLPFRDIKKALRNFKRSGSRYLLTTTFPAVEENRDIRRGGWRSINLELPPISLPKPIRLLTEECTPEAEAEGKKSLGLWELEQIRL